MTTDPNPDFDRIPITRSVSYAVRGAPELPAHGATILGTTLSPDQVTFTYRAAPDSQLGRIQARVKGFWMRDGGRVNPGQPMAQHYFDGLTDWPEWLAEEARLHDPAAAVPVAAPPTTEQTAEAPAAECSAQNRNYESGPRLCIRAAQHRGDHIDERGFHWSDTVAVYPVSDGTFRSRGATAAQPAAGACPHSDTWFDRSVCLPPCGAMHQRCVDCETAVDDCPNDAVGVRQDGPTAYSDGKGRVFCTACPRPDAVDVPVTVEDVDPWELCPSCGRHVVDVARTAAPAVSSRPGTEQEA